ncbi:hypothetical protein BV25DRAFT_1810990 [Artomyces pyxidatus]|uniref:Uncharacterized protein n=1 Tax=Artomyces pyxidatus TaxID=48021 RepID=A0ACB8SQL8_9AGAM|nr:hypothetical protein BV25DRAFT_1810990 [Artomyces pyxidatus]
MPTSYSHGRVGRSATTKPRRESFDVNPASASLHHRSKSSRRAHDEGRPSTSSGYPEPRAEVRTQVAWQQRVFIEDMQRYNMLEIDPTTTARDVIRMLERQKQLEERKGAGGWMLFEVAHDFGMERPIRGFEIVSEVVNSWDKDKSVNFLVAKMTPLAVLLHPSTMPSSSPRHNGYVEWESKKGKWNKRWLELREHGLWLSKKDNGKDETFLCSLANFDAYTVTRLHKSPKPFVFAVKSTDNLTFFENAADYVHVFCCPDKDGQKWLEGILLARSYVINQERNIISTTSMPPSSAGPGKSLSRSGTRKGARPAQPLVNVSAPSSLPAMPAGNVFEPGSLLAKR